jgi:large exoprotein involved in heme utilization and adhesion
LKLTNFSTIFSGNINENGTISTNLNTASGGNILIALNGLLLLRNNVDISTSSYNSGKNSSGGNITINSPLIVATPGNNDIKANANGGNGGNIDITSQGLFGIQYRPTGSDVTNDITASSTFGLSGTVNINTPGTDPAKDKGELSEATNDASNQISQACGSSQRDNKFYITGRGGLPPNASEPQESDALWSDAREVNPKPATTTSQAPKYAPPAIGWVFQPDGRVRLIAAQTAAGSTGTQVICPNK